MHSERDYLRQPSLNDDDMMFLDARATLAAALSRAVVGYSDGRVRALSLEEYVRRRAERRER